MSTRFWSFIAAGALILFAILGFAIGYWLNRPSKSKTQPSENDPSS